MVLKWSPTNGKRMHRQLYAWELRQMFCDVKRILNLDATLLIPGFNLSEKLVRNLKNYEKGMAGSALAVAIPLGGHTMIILNRQDIYDSFYQVGDFAAKKWPWDGKLYKPWNLHQSYCLNIIHELTHVGEFIDEGIVRPGYLKKDKIEKLFTEYFYLVKKTFGSHKRLRLEERKNASGNKKVYVHDNRFFELYHSNIRKCGKYLNELEDVENEFIGINKKTAR